MNFLPLILTAHRGNWARYAARISNKAFLAAQARIFKRDDHTCRFCGFQAHHFQTVINVDHNYDNNAVSNLVTACSFCAQCFFLDAVGKDDKTGGHVIHLPEISQADLNHFCRILFCSMQKDPPYKGKLQAVYLSLKDRGHLVEEVFGPETANPKVFGQAMIDSAMQNQKIHPILQQLRLLPSRKPFKKQTEYWQSTIFSQIPL